MEHQVFIPSLHRDLTGDVEVVTLTGTTVGDIIDGLEAKFPGLGDRLAENGRIKPYISVAVNGEMLPRGLRQKLTQPSEIHFVPALGGG
ncbi:MAG: MoaD/ThiS family protein [Litorilinea sp.]